MGSKNRSRKSKVRKGFYGRRPQQQAHESTHLLQPQPTTSSSHSCTSRSAMKLGAIETIDMPHEENFEDYYILFNNCLLLDFINKTFACPNCCTVSLHASTKVESKVGYAVEVCVSCSNCEFYKSFFNSRTVSNAGAKPKRKKVI